MSNDAIERISATLSMAGSAIPEDIDLESPEIKALLDSMEEGQRNRMLAMAKNPDDRKLNRAFHPFMADYYQSLVNAKEEGKKIVFTPFTLVPEIIYAMDMIPLCADMLSVSAMALEEGVEPYLDLVVERGLPDTMCAVQKIPIGLLEADMIDKPELLINSALGSCDPNTKAYEYVSEKFNIPAVYLDIPYDIDKRSMDYYTNGLRKMIKAIEEMTGQKLDIDHLKEICELSNKSTELFFEIHELKRNVPNPVPNAFSGHFQGLKLTNPGTPQAVEYLQLALDVVKDRLKRGAHVKPEEKIRCMFMWVGYFFDSTLPFWFEEEKGVSYLNDLFTFHDFVPIIDTSSEEAMFRGLAETMFNLPMVRQLHGGMDMPGSWVNDLLYYGETYKADCMVFSGNLSCKHVWGAYRLASDAVKRELGIPCLRLEGDSWDSRITPMSVIKQNLEDFFETIM